MGTLARDDAFVHLAAALHRFTQHNFVFRIAHALS
jgi:hypothetical protein